VAAAFSTTGHLKMLNCLPQTAARNTDQQLLAAPARRQLQHQQQLSAYQCCQLSLQVQLMAADGDLLLVAAAAPDRRPQIFLQAVQLVSRWHLEAQPAVAMLLLLT
jgi:hypothetical protein